MATGCFIVDVVVGDATVGTLSAAAIRSDRMPELGKLLPVVGMGIRRKREVPGAGTPGTIPDTKYVASCFVVVEMRITVPYDHQQRYM